MMQTFQENMHHVKIQPTKKDFVSSTLKAWPFYALMCAWVTLEF
jgi:hypothetical protein